MTRRCRVCGCTETTACHIVDDRNDRPCGWAEADLCDAPRCLASRDFDLIGGAEVVRRCTLDAGREVVAEVEKLPPSSERTTFLTLSMSLQVMWERASDDFLRQWFEVSTKVAAK